MERNIIPKGFAIIIISVIFGYYMSESSISEIELLQNMTDIEKIEYFTEGQETSVGVNILMALFLLSFGIIFYEFIAYSIQRLISFLKKNKYQPNE